MSTKILLGNVQGPPGPTGATGPKGNTGATGDTGPAGPTGPAPDVVVTSVNEDTGDVVVTPLSIGALTPDGSGAALTDITAAQVGADISGAAAAVLATSAQKSANLSDLASASTARTNLGLGSAATQSTSAFDASGAAATAQAASLQKSANLSDLASVSTARTNLGLGSAATQASSAFDASGAAAAAAAASVPVGDLPLSIPNGGTGQETQQAALDALAGAVTANQVLGGNGTHVVLRALAAADIPQLTNYAPTGLTGATAASRYVGATVSGPPVSGTYAVGDYAVDQAGAIWIAVSAGAAPINGQFRRMGDHAWQFRPESYGATTGIFTVHDAVMASTGSGVLTSASGKFTAAMVGWLVLVNIGTAGANQAPLITTIASYQSATQVTLAANPAATAAGNPAIFAPDNTTALLACWTATQTYANASPFRSAEMVLADLYAMGTAPTLGSTAGPFYGYSLLPINVPDTTGAGPKMNLRIACERGPGDETNYWEQLTGQMAGSGIVVLLAAPATNGTWGIPSVIGGPTVASWSGGSLTGGFANIRLDVDDLKIVVPYNPGWIGVDARFLACLSGTRYGYQSFAAGVLGGGLGPNLGSTPGGSWNFNGAGIRFPVRNNNDLSSFDSVTCEGVADGIWIADHIDIRKLTVINHFNSIVVDATSGSGSGFIHGSWIGEASLEATGGSCVIVSGSGETHFPLVIGFLDSENSSTPNTVTDTGILFGHIQWYDITTSVPKVSGTTNLKIVNNRLGPGLWGSPPSVPATTVAVTAANSPWRDAWVNVQPNGATITAIAVTTNGTATTITGVTSGWVFIPSGSTITLTYTGGTPTWQWWLS